jgi:hypothetical protein
VVELAKVNVGVSVAVFVLALYETVAATVVLPFFNKMVLLLTVATLSAWLNVIVSAAFAATFVAALAGVKPVTVGGGATVVKPEVALAASALPATSLTPLAPPTSTIV